LVLVPVEWVLELLDADDVHLGLRQTIIEDFLDALVSPSSHWNIQQAVILL